MSQPIRVVVADDSPFVCRLLAAHLRSDPGIEVVATVLNGARAVETVAELRPDVVTLDLEMPEVNGLEAVRRTMADTPTPIVVISGVSGRAATMTMQALDFGAVDFVLKYQPGMAVDPKALRAEIVGKVRQAARIRVVRTVPSRRPAKRTVGRDVSATPKAFPTKSPSTPLSTPSRVVVIGASTGGPVALRQLLSRLPADVPLAIAIVQHMPASFTGALATQLQRFTDLVVREAVPDELPTPGTVLVAPGDHHLLFGPQGRVRLHQGSEVHGHRPSIDVTMQSAAQTFGARARGVLLTGMGRDGVSGLLAIRNRGGITFAQDRDSCVVFGMPGGAIEAGVVDHVAPPWQLASWLATPPTTLHRQPAPDGQALATTDVRTVRQ